MEHSFKPFLPFLEENLTPGYSLLPFFFCTDEGKVGESVTHQLHLQLSPVNAALKFWRDGDRFRREARASDGRGFGRPGRSDAGMVVKCELMDDEPLKHVRHILTTALIAS